jgi:acyl dehydratase
MPFSSFVMDHHPYVSDEHFAAEEGLFGRRLVAGAVVFSLGLGPAATNCLNSCSYGNDRRRFIAPVFISVTIYTIRENPSKEVHVLRQGKVRVSYSVYKGGGEQVRYAEHLMTALYRDPAPFAAEAAQKLAAKAARKARADG